jgi:dolichol-phosphate mannosyltransferase
MIDDASAISIIVPTLREAPNIATLADRVFDALAANGLTGELIIVDDDSRDGTEEIVADLSRRHAIRLVTRHGKRGLSAAVLDGFQAATHDLLVVMDADLQHPPEAIPRLVRLVDAGDCDMAFGSRFVTGGSVHEQWSFARRAVSRVAMWLTRPLLPIKDPASGFFALRRETWDRATDVRPIGFKIGLELAIKSGSRRYAEIPIAFSTRSAGDSKLTLTEEIRFLRHLLHLYDFRLRRLPMRKKSPDAGAENIDLN